MGQNGSEAKSFTTSVGSFWLSLAGWIESDFSQRFLGGFERWLMRASLVPSLFCASDGAIATRRGGAVE